ncbi:hypothetical protein J7E50_06395 [Pedobacter sp. ISL-68]|uniref:hypothetical protein n=1 Tax=unclassified Pedobacter TaxID=2628915 RepID=UPI001BE91B1C|nr:MULTISPECIES: hypothetical protein [unclassified Pedobacter]MBT2564510.1 hypothetical protein [Pedobacter sp. ISL-64]MBT2589840.1 hypothetical protein [Pedobacter sp. ISL-68]
MKKFLKITAAIVILLLIFFAGVLKYRKYQAGQTLIPQNATGIIKINVDELYQTIALNMLGNPGYYFKSDVKKANAIKIDKYATGLSVPASIYFYTLAGQPLGTVFSRLELKNSADFENFAKNVLHLQIIKKAKGISMAKSRLGNFVLCYNNKAVAMVITPQIKGFDTILTNILNQKKMVRVAESPFKEVLDQKQHVVFANTKNNGWIDFKSGSVNFSNVFLAKDILPATQSVHHQFNQNSTVSFWLNANLNPGNHKVYKFKNFNLEQDSLIKYYNGKLDFEWTNSITQTDSIITYEYNDDFEKVEKISLQKRNIPSISVNFGSKGNGLKNYLAKQGLINLDSNVVNKNAFPLYKVFVSSNQENLNFSTVKNQNTLTSNVTSTDFLYLNVDLMKLAQRLETPFVTSYFKTLKNLEVKGKFLDSKKVKIDGKLELKNRDINSLYQILKSL